MADRIEYAYAGDIIKAERNAAGNLEVFGLATDATLDLDDQVADPAWLKQAMPEWQRWGNLREMHQPIVAGIGRSLEEAGDGKWFLKSEVVDAGTAKKIEAGALKGYSIGIKNARVVKDKAAPGGRIVGGTIVEVSYVDRPCNPSATLMVAKAAGADTAALTAVERPTPALMARMLGKDAAQKCNSGAGTSDALRDAEGQPGDVSDNDDEQVKPRKVRGNPKPGKKGQPVADLTSSNADGTPAPNHSGSTGKTAQPIPGADMSDAGDSTGTGGYQKPAKDDCPLCKGKGKFKARKGAMTDIEALAGRLAKLEKRVKANGQVVDSSGADRSSVPAGDFAGPGKTFPIENQSDVADAASLAHHAADPAAVRAKIRSIAMRKWPDMTLPPSLKAAKADKAVSADAVKAAVDTATAELRAELAALKAKPVSGGPVVHKIAGGDAAREDGKAQKAADAARYRELADRTSDRELADGYAALAKACEADLAK